MAEQRLRVVRDSAAGTPHVSGAASGPVVQVDLAAPDEPATAAPAAPADSAASAEPADPAQPAQPVDPAEPADPAPESGGDGAHAAPRTRSGRKKLKSAAVVGAAAALIAGVAGTAVLLLGSGGDTLGGLAARLPAGGKHHDQPPANGGSGRGGDPAPSGKLRFTVTGVHTGLERVGGAVQGEYAQGRFVIVRIAVRNAGERATMFTDADQLLVDSAGRRYRPDNTAGLQAGNSDRLFGRLGPGKEVRGGLVFDVPRGTDPAALHLQDFTAADAAPAVIRLDA
ncbi:DUF4352 domain-containing protein [Streptomonospora sediminis]